MRMLTTKFFYLNAVVRVLFLFVPLILVGCAPRPVYVPPVDIFEESRNDFDWAKKVLNEAIRQSEDTKTWYTSTTEEISTFNQALTNISLLAKQSHAPSVYILGRYLLAAPKSYFETGGLKNKFEKQYLEIAKKNGITRKKLHDIMLSRKSEGLKVMHVSARYGYPPARAYLTEQNLSIPAKDLSTSGELQAHQTYKTQLQNWESSQQNQRAFLSALGGALAAGATAYSQSLNSRYSGGTTSQSAFVPSQNSYDWSSGNSYTTKTDGLGNTHVSGFNANTGNIWNSTIESDGDQHGYDASGNYWTYKENTGTYFNYGTSRMCVGKGEARTCF